MSKSLIFILVIIVILIPDFTNVHAEQADRNLLNELQWRCIGPANPGGRIDDFAVEESDPSVIYAGTASGGLWKTVNSGITWTPVFDHQETSSIGDVTVAPSNPEIVWVGTGEPNNRQSSSWGDGVYKSTDGGITWTYTGLKDTHHIGRIAAHPHNPDIVYIAALGHLWGPNPERGLFKTTDGGRTWEKSLYINEDTGCVDLVMDPESPETLYAAAYQRRRTGWGFNGGGPGSGIYKTTDGGAEWVKLSGGLPEGITGRIGLSVCRSRPEIVYACMEHKNGGVFRSEDKGLTWEKMSNVNPRPMYYSKIRVDPNNDLRIWLLGASMYYSEDGGRNWDTDLIARSVREKRAVHGDHHALWINPHNSNHMVLGSDGGVYLSYDRGQKWIFRDNLPIGQVYELGLDMSSPYNIGAGLQDNGTWYGPSAAWFRPRITNDEWFKIGGADGFYVQIDPRDPDRIYVESQNAGIQRLNRKTREYQSIKPVTESPEETYRFNWNSPFLLSPHDPDTLYLGGNRLFISHDRGDTWTATKDLTAARDRSRLSIMDVPDDEITLSKHDGISYYGTLTTISESPLRAGLIYSGADDGTVQISEDGGKTWTDLTGNFPGLPQYTYVSRIECSNLKEERVYISFDGHRNDDFTPYIFISENKGRSWRRISQGIPEGKTVNVIREHPGNPGLLFAGTERGAYFSLNRGDDWNYFHDQLPMVPVDDIAVHPRDNDLIFGTHGRSIWILDDITALEKFTPEIQAKPLVLFDMRLGVIINFFSRKAHYDYKGLFGHAVFRAPNPPDGVFIDYYLKENMDNPVTILVQDQAGNSVRRLTEPGEKGIHRVIWDLRYGYPAPNPPAKPEMTTGPSVIPGTFTVKIQAGEYSEEKMVTVRTEAVIQTAPEALAARRNALITIYRQWPVLTQTEQTRTQLIKDLSILRQRLSGKSKEIPEVFRRIKDIEKTLTDITHRLQGQPDWGSDRRFHAVAGLRSIAVSLERTTRAPSEQELDLIRKKSNDLGKLVDDLNQIIQTSIPELNQMLNAAGIAHIKAPERINNKNS
jgi:photosystem II stability/assembly factor-like uncharacterized protein